MKKYTVFMITIFKEVRVLQQEGKVHQKLITRTRILFFLSLALAAVTAYQLLFKGADPAISGMLFFIGLLLGLFVFSRMSAVTWNEEKSQVENARMDIVGFAVLGLYIVLEIGLRTFLVDFYPASSTAFILAGICGILLGRAVGTVVEIHRVYQAIHGASPSRTAA